MGPVRDDNWDYYVQEEICMSLRNRIEKIEQEVGAKEKTYKGLMTWGLHVSSNKSAEEEQRLMGEIKAGRVSDKDGRVYSEEYDHLYIVVVNTRPEEDIDFSPWAELQKVTD